MEYMGTKEAAAKWDCSQNTVTAWCRDGIIQDAEQDAKGSPWRIPVDTPDPRVHRAKSKNKKRK